MEMIIVVVLVAMIVTIAIPTYRSYILKSNRADAIHTLLAIQLAQEKYRMNNSNYGTLTQVWSGVTSTDKGYYNLAISNVSTTSYTITATAVGNQASDMENGNSCATLTLSFANNVTTKTPAACWMD